MSNITRDEVVISGISGRLPESNNIEEFKQHLFDGVDMVTTDDDRRWPAGIYGLPKRSGKLKDIKHFDAAFFGVHPKQAQAMDPQLRLLLEVTYEAIIDAGVNPVELKGSKTGVYVGSLLSESLEFWTSNEEQSKKYAITGCNRSMFANRISYTLDLTGPSISIDTACSSSLTALQQAVDAIKKGDCETAIVAGTSLLLNPLISLQFHKLGMLSPDGKCKTFDASGAGYVRSEAVVAVLLQRTSKAKRAYATVLGGKCNADGFKQEGVTFASRKMQNQLITEVYIESGIDPADVIYLETHGTGTRVGDPQELKSVADAFCKSNRKSPLLVGSVKSNMGHSEAASGLCGIAKIVIAMESGVMPGNLHFENPNPDVPALLDGRLKVVTKNQNWKGGLVGVNSFGFGGANVHVVLSSNPKPKPQFTPTSLPRLITVSGRTGEAVNYFLDKIKEQNYNEELYALTDHIFKRNITGHNHRGFCLLGQEGSEKVKRITNDKPQIWFIFTGMGCQWPGMGKDLMNFEPFEKSIKRSAEALKPYGVDLIDIIVNGDANTFDNLINSFVSVTAIQIALVDILRLINIEPDGFIGHSIGEIGCAYADGTLTPEQAIILAYIRATSVSESKLPSGAMASVGLKWEDFRKRAPADIFVACHNSEYNLTISGPPLSMQKFISELSKEGIFTKTLNIFGLAFHSKYIAEAGPKMRKGLDALISNPKPRSSRWISSSISESDRDKPWTKTSSPEYHVNNLLSPVYFYEATRNIPENAIVLELAPHHLLLAVLKRSLPKNVTNIGLLQKGRADNVSFLLSNIGRVYMSGGQPNISVLYPTVSFPVASGTPMLNSMIKWDHSMEWDVPNFSSNLSRSAELVVEIDLRKDEFKYLCSHVIDERILFPATGYMKLVWETFAKLRNQDFEQVPVVLENVKFLKTTILPKEGTVKFLINIFEGTGEFEICESGSVTATGRIYAPEEIDPEFLKLSPQKPTEEDTTALPLNTSDVYKELHLRGYNYEGGFKGITRSTNLGFNGHINWENNWVTFLDTMLQFSILRKDTRKLHLPTAIQKMIINPKAHNEFGLKEFSVSIYHYNDVIKSGGIELRGLKTTIVPRRKETQPPPKLETYQFVPFENNNSSEKSILNTLTIASQLVFENSNGALELKVVEVVTDKKSSGNLLLNVKELMEAEPTLSVDATTINVTADKKDVATAPFEENYHLVILTYVLSNENSELIANAVLSLKTGGFILFQEPKTHHSELITKHSLKVVFQQTVGNETYILARRPIEIPDEPIIINITERNYNWVESLKKATLRKVSKIYLVCQGEKLSGLVGLLNCAMEEPDGLNARCFFIQDNNAEPFSISSIYYRNQLQKDLAQNILKNGVWGTYRHLLLDQSFENKKLHVEHAFVNSLTRGDLASLEWIESPLRFHAEEGENSKLCSVYYASLNFKDVMLASGKLATEPLQADAIEQDYLLGLEFAGRDCRGRRVMGLVEGKSIATTVLSRPDFLWKVPEKWSLEEAATIPVAYSTSYYALIIRGKMQAGESILIHAGAGGVGQASISIALHMGCKVFTTVGSQIKRDFLKKRYPQVTDDCIGYSRDTSFEQMIQNQTDGRGVDLVLNSLAGDQLQASMRCLAPGGRFLEIGRVDINEDSPMGLSAFSTNTSFHGIRLDLLSILGHRTSTEIKRLVDEGVVNGAIRPLTRTIFHENQVEEAFRLIASGKHIGKVVLKIRDETMDPLPKTICAIPKSYMNPEKVYVLVGGLGGFGLELTNWLITRGAKKIVLSSRNGVKSGYQSLCIRRWKNKNVNIHISTADVTTLNGAKKLLNESSKFGPVGGIFNLAIILSDALLCNQSEENFKIVCRPKVEITKHLDAISRISAPYLDYFITFSSISSGRGIIGQANYGYGNSVMERICENRHAAGLPALAIQWGGIGDVGFIVDSLTGVAEVKGTLLQSISSCLSALDIFLQQTNPVVSSLVLKNKGKGEIEKKNQLSHVVANILGISDYNSVSGGITVGDLGMDSLMSTEIKQTLERNYDISINAKEIGALTFERLLELENRSSCNDNNLKGNLMPASSCIKMLSNETSKKYPVFIIHSIGGAVDELQTLAGMIQAPVFGLQCTAAVPLTSIVDMASYYVKEIKNVQGNGPYRLIGYSFGACLAFEIGIQLESNENVKIMFIDGSPKYFATFSGSIVCKSGRSTDVATEQTEVALYYLQQFMETDDQKLAEKFMSMKSWDERVDKVIEIISSISTHPSNTIKESINSFYKRIIAGESYQPSAIFKGDAILVKASENCVKAGEDYGLNSICKQKITVKTLNGNHKSIVKNPDIFEVANSFFQ